MKNEKLEKQASSEIAQSRERFEKAFAAKYYTVDQLAKRTMADLWEQAERDTRERCAQIVKEEADHYQTIEWFETARSFRRVVERIRGKE